MSDTILPNTPQKQCTKCLKQFPATPEYFHIDKWKKGGLKTRCKACEYAQEKARLSNPDAQARRKATSKANHSRPEVQERRKAYQKEYQNRPGIREYQQARQKAYLSRPEIKARYQANRKTYNARHEIREKHRTYGETYRRNPKIQEREKARRKTYRSQSEIQAKEKAFRKTYNSRPEVKERYRVRTRNRTALKKSIPGTHTPQQIQEMLKRQRYRCYYCSNKFEKRKGRYHYHIEHTFPISRVAGMDIPANDISYLVLSCKTCNLSKNNKFPWEWPEGGRLF